MTYSDFLEKQKSAKRVWKAGACGRLELQAGHENRYPLWQTYHESHKIPHHMGHCSVAISPHFMVRLTTAAA